MKQPSKRSTAALLRKFAVACAGLLAALALLQPGFANASAMVDTIVVKYRDDALPAGATRLPDGDRALLGHMRKANFVEIGRNRDGAFRIAVDPPLSIDEARAAMNRMRLNPAVLYVGIAERNVMSKSTAAALASAGNQRPVRALIVKYRDPQLVENALADRPLPTAQLQRVADVAQMPVATMRTMGEGQYLVQLFQSMSASAAFYIAEQLENDAEVEYADPDLWVSPTLVPNDTCYPINTNPACFNAQFSLNMHMWHLMPGGTEVGGANLPPAWDLTTGHVNITVGVIDTGNLPNHPDLAGRFVAGYDFIVDFALANDSQPVQSAACLQGNDPRLYDPMNPPCVSSRDNDPSDPGDWIDAADFPGTGSSWFVGCPVSPSSWHGSHTAGTIGAVSNNAAGIAGINWNSKLQALRTLGKCGGYSSDIVDAIIWGSGGTVPGISANATPARVLNLSLGGSGSCPPSYQSAINGALSRGTVVAISAGNTNTNASNNFPANCLGNITVAATQRQGIKAQYSAFGTSVEIAAPGGGRNYPDPPTVRHLVISTINNGATTPNPSGYIYEGFNGTSMSAPHVAGVASLMLSRNPTLTPAQVLSTIQSTARPFPVLAGATCPSSQSCNCTTSLCGAGLLDAGAALAAVAPVVNHNYPDFNHDGKSDLSWRNTSTGTTSLWLMNGITFSSAKHILPDRTWSLTNKGDLNGDGKTDLVWRNSDTGQTAAWLQDGLTMLLSDTLLSDPNWFVSLVADLSGDGKGDLIWRNTVTGQTAVWIMNGLTRTLSDILISDANWVVYKTGDFNGDGYQDLLLRNNASGATGIWLMNGLTSTSATLPVAPPWTATHVGDFNGDGKDDLLWRNTVTGETAIWLMDGLTMTSSAVIYTSLPWAVTHVGDTNGDGRDDLVWRNTSTGQTAVWLMNGTSALPSGSAVVSGDHNWVVTHVGDTNGDRKSDLLWRNSSTGATVVWLMNGLTYSTFATLLPDSTWTLFPPDGF